MEPIRQDVTIRVTGLRATGKTHMEPGQTDEVPEYATKGKRIITKHYADGTTETVEDEFESHPGLF